MNDKKDTNTIETLRLTLICCNKEMLETLMEGDAALAKTLNVHITPDWTQNGEREFRWIENKLSVTDARWLFYVARLQAENRLVGCCGFKGAPQAGMVEIGYEVAPAYRCKGLATEMAQALIGFAFQHSEVTKVQAHTLAVENESGRVLQKCGMQKMEELEDPEDGRIWRWEIRK